LKSTHRGGSEELITSLRSTAAINAAVTECRSCPRLIAHCQAVAEHKTARFRDWSYWGRPVPAFGDPHARLLIVGLAPAAHGANRTGRMFTGDSSGDWLYDALHRAGFASQPSATGRDDGLRLSNCYITAAARCAPPQNRPTAEELARCRVFLEAEIQTLKHVKVVLVLGHIAFESWLRASGLHERLPPSERPRFSHGAEVRLPNSQTLLCSYHPSRQNTNTGRLTRAMWLEVFDRAKSLVVL